MKWGAKKPGDADDSEPFEPPQFEAYLRKPKEKIKRGSGKTLAPADRVNRRKPEGPLCGQPLSPRGERGGEGTCQHRAGFGTEHPGWGPCKYHGGNRKKYRIESVRMIVAQKIKQGVYGDPMTIDPDQALLMEVHRTAGHVEWLRQRIQEIGESKGDAVLMQYTDAFGMGASVWVDMYQKERQHLVRVAKAAIDAGVSVRQVEIAEQQARIMAMVMISFIEDADLGLDYLQKLNARKLMRKHLENSQAITMPALPENEEVEHTIMEAQLVEDDEEMFD